MRALISIVLFIFIANSIFAGEISQGEQDVFITAIQNNDVKKAEELLKGNPAFIRARIAQSDCPPLQLAVRTDDLALVELLLKYGADVNETTKIGHTALRAALPCKNEALIKLLIEKGANPMARENNGFSVFDAALFGKHPVAIRAMLDSGKVLPNDRNPSSGKSAVIEAASTANKEVLEELIAKGGDVNLKSLTRDITALHWAVIPPGSPERFECIKILVGKKANILALDDLGYTPFHRCASFSGDTKIDILEFFLNKEPKLLDMADKDGNSALLLAGRAGNIATIQYLLKKGANASHKNKRGQTFLDLAKTETLEKLKNAGVKVK